MYNLLTYTKDFILKKLFLFILFYFIFSLAQEDDNLLYEYEKPQISAMPDTAGKTGLLFTANTDSVEILSDSVIFGYTPFILDTLQDGTYSFLARKKGFYQKRITLTYRADTLSKVNIELREPASISFITYPDSASILINRKKAGVSPFTAQPLKPDEEYNIMVLKDGYKLFNTDIILKSGAKDTLLIDLAPENPAIQNIAVKSDISNSVEIENNIENNIYIKKKTDRIGIIIFLSVMGLLVVLQEVGHR